MKKPHLPPRPMLELPAFEELDRSVLETLPEELKKEVMEYYERSGVGIEEKVIENNSEEGKEVERLLKWMMAMRSELEEEKWVMEYVSQHDPSQELSVVMKELIKTRLQCDVKGCERIVAVLRKDARDRNETWKSLVEELEGIIEEAVRHL